MTEHADVPANVPAGVDPTTMSTARVYDYILGGTNNFEVDRAGAERLRTVFPELEDWAWSNRGFHQRAAGWMATTGDIGQFIDVGSGLPTQNNTHEAVHEVRPDARVVYVDNDPTVVAYAQALLAETGNTVFVAGDARNPEKLLADPELRRLIDFERPVGLLMTAVLHFIADEFDPWGMVQRYMAAVAPGSYIALSHGVVDKLPEGTGERIADIYRHASATAHPRTEAEVRRLFAGLELVPPYDGAQPAVTYGGLWGAEDPEAADTEGSRSLLVGVARKP
jgi:hypothetical protein